MKYQTAKWLQIDFLSIDWIVSRLPDFSAGPKGVVWLFLIRSLLNVLKHASKQKGISRLVITGEFLVPCFGQRGIVQRSPGKTVIWDSTKNSGPTSNASRERRVTSVDSYPVICLILFRYQLWRKANLA